ncbi:RNA polymerase sigma factor SigJ [Microbacterium sp. 179-I 3D4 NHS]|uniref:RNA polymerase sigma factor SigJ n=1 Tax=Microbacterium sp. 179-I 3D4 NHS TaxID=3142381 RepID=UPI0039A299D8
MHDDADDVSVERRRLTALAYRMTGTLADAEDVVQETYVRWYRMTDAERSGIRNPGGWLTTVASRISLDLLTSAPRRREQYVGQWLPEPVPLDLFVDHGRPAPTTAVLDDPFERVALDESVSTALLVVLEAMTPAERVAFVLHDIFDVPFGEIAEIIDRSPAAVRQLATSARRHVREQRATVVPRAEHDRVVRAFQRASRTGLVEELLRVLAPDVELRSDGGGVVRAALNTVSGADRVARFLLGIAGKRPDMRLEELETGDGLAFLFREHGDVVSVMNLGVQHDRVSRLWIMMNPEKLSHWRAPLSTAP